ncbi:MAG: type VI secretion system baseplate subunit TssG [Polyangiaceae bacterium]
MGAEERSSLSDLSPELRPFVERGPRFGFFQLLYMLERVHAGAPIVGGDGPVAAEKLRMRPTTSLNFPSSDIERVEEITCGDGVKRTRVTTTFLGLYGVDSPLFTYFVEQLAQAEYQGLRQPVRDFLDTLHHRLLALLYRTWTKYRLYVGYRSKGQDAFTRRMLCAAGIDGFGTHNPPIHKFLFLRYAPMLAWRSRSARGLNVALHEMFGKMGVHIEQFVGAWTPIEKPYRNRLGQANASLGQSLTIGRFVFDASSRYKIVLGPLGYDDYLAFLPGGHRRPLLRGICAVFTRGMYDVLLELHVKPDAAPRFQLGSPRASTLKRTAWLGGPKKPFILTVPLEDPKTDVAAEDEEHAEPPPNPFEENAESF